MEVIISQLTRRLGAPPNVYLKHRSYHIAAIAIGDVQKKTTLEIWLAKPESAGESRPRTMGTRVDVGAYRCSDKSVS